MDNEIKKARLRKKISVIIGSLFLGIIILSFTAYFYLADASDNRIAGYSPIELIRKSTSAPISITLENLLSNTSSDKYKTLPQHLGKRLSDADLSVLSNRMVLKVNNNVTSAISSAITKGDNYIIVIDSNDMIIGIGVIYEDSKGCDNTCNEDNKPVFYYNVDSDFYDTYYAPWLKKDEQLFIKQKRELSLIIIEESSDLLPIEEKGFIITDKLASEIDKAIYEGWKVSSLVNDN